MAEAIPHLSASLRPITKPNLPGAFLELEVTPEKFHKTTADNKPAVKGCKKKVVFSEDVGKSSVSEQRIGNIKSVLPPKQSQYPSLEDPLLNSTYGITKQMEKLKVEKRKVEKGRSILPDSTVLQLDGDKTTTALNFKRHRQQFKDLVSVDIDKYTELRKMAPKRTIYEKEAIPRKAETEEVDIWAFWTDDLITDSPKLDYDKDLEEMSFEPDTLANSLDYLGDLYFCKEIASQLR